MTAKHWGVACFAIGAFGPSLTMVALYEKGWTVVWLGLAVLAVSIAFMGAALVLLNQAANAPKPPTVSNKS